MEFTGRTAVVTGGASGIGAAVVNRLLEGGARVAVLDLSIDSVNPAALAVVANISDSSSVRDAIASIVRELNGIDILVNNAGVGAQGTVESVDDVEWASVLAINVTGIARVSSAAMSYLRQSDSASIVNMASIAGTAGLQNRALYSASKGAVIALTRAMAADHLREGIRVNCVSPGTADTPWVSRLLAAASNPARERAALTARQPHGRLVEPREVAEAVAYLASPLNRSTTGTNIAVDGGMQELRLRPEGS